MGRSEDHSSLQRKVEALSICAKRHEEGRWGELRMDESWHTWQRWSLFICLPAWHWRTAFIQNSSVQIPSTKQKCWLTKHALVLDSRKVSSLIVSWRLQVIRSLISLYLFFYSLHTTALQHYTYTIQLTYLESVEVQQTGCWSLRTLASVPGDFLRLSIVAKPGTGPRVSQGNV